MKKIGSVLIALILLFCSFSFVGCSNGSFRQSPVSLDDDVYNYAVLSNGGSAVQYGKYIYFINGHRGYEDETGKENSIGKVIKGGLYRTEMIDPLNSGGKTARDYTFSYGNVELNYFAPSFDATSHLQFKSTKQKGEAIDWLIDDDGEFVLDDNDEKIAVNYADDTYAIKSERIIGKTIGTSGFKAGGIFIYDNYIFFASPNNNANNKNEIQYKRTDFWVTTLDGSVTKKLYTTANDTQNSDYMFYKYDNSYYLVSFDGNNIVSVRMDSKGDIKKPQTIASNVKSVLFPNTEIYYNFSKNGTRYSSFEHTAENFIYFTRDANKDDSKTVGQVMEMLRPNGTDGFKLVNTGGSVTLLGSDNGVIFYETSGKTVHYNNFHTMLLNNSTKYKAAHDALNHDYVDVSGSLSVPVPTFTSVKCFYPNPNLVNDVRILTFGSSVSLYTLTAAPYTIYNGAASFVGSANGYVYISTTDETNYTLSRISLEGGSRDILTAEAKAATFTFDLLDEYFLYFGDVDDLLLSAAHIKRIDDFGLESYFIGERTEDETPDEE